MAILGIDEVGRGPLAGPLVVGAVILPENKPEWVFELKDSKKLSVKKRELLNELILKEAVATGLGWVFPEELDNVGIAEALRLATRRAVKSVQGLHASFSQIVIDGKVNFLAETALGRYVSTMPKADNLVKEVSAASIIAKVARDHYMYDVGLKFPGYGFEKHVGYGTAAHLRAIRELGICKEHRKSFEPIKSMVGFESKKNVVKNTTVIGGRAEEKVAEYLVEKGHKIVEQNFKTKFCEIDIVSVLDDMIYFTEVKYRKNDSHGGGLYAVDKKKLQKMKFAVEVFLKMKKEYAGFSPILAVADVDGEYLVREWFTLD
ncbi:ribonuclease HII [Candidatus Saccharibacteria bacterium]|nr:ribonuclease HII [Candidatus Saccharibacteria bacterium]